MIPFPLFSFFSPSFFILHTCTAFFSFFFSPSHTYPYTFHFLLLSSFVTYYFLQTLERSSSPSSFFFFFFHFFLSPFTKNIPLLFSFLFLLSSFFPLLFSALCFFQNVPQTHKALLQSFFLFFFFFFFLAFSLSTSSVTPMQGIDFFFFP